jgi:hypothetical protein
MLAELIQLKATGMTFEQAWAAALRRYPTHGFTRKDRNRREDSEQSTEWLYRVCADAWYGRRPALAAFTIDLVAA